MDLEDLLDITLTTATKSETPLEESPSIVTVFTRKDMDRLGARRLSDLLQYVPGFYEVSSQLERNFAVRGIHAASPQHFIVLVNGLAMNDFLTSSADPDSFELDVVERVEIVRGAGSAIYGANALASVINLITKDGRHEGFRHTVAAGTGAYLRTSLSQGIDLGDAGSLFVAASFWRSAGSRYAASPREDVLLPRIGQNISDGVQADENLTQPRVGASVPVNRFGPSVDLHLRYAIPNGWALGVGFTRTDRYLQRNHLQSLVNPDREIVAPRYILQRGMVSVEKWFGDRKRAGQLTLRTALTLHTHDLRSPRIGRDFYSDPEITRFPELDQNAVVYGWSGTDLRLLPSIEYAVDLPDASIFHRSSIVAGVQPEYGVAFDYRQRRCFLDLDGRFPSPSIYGLGSDVFCREEVFVDEGLVADPFGNAVDNDTDHVANGDEWRGGAFVQYGTFLPSDIGVVVGARVDAHSAYSPEVSPRAAVVSRFGPGLYGKAQVSRAFIFPAFLYRTGNAFSPYGEAASKPTQPQAVTSYELLLGVKRPYMRLELNGYFNRITDFITYDLARNAQSGRYEFSNQGNINIAGMENSTQITLFNDRLNLHLLASLAVPIARGTDDKFLVGGKLGGPTKFPQLMGGLVVSGKPTEPVDLTFAVLAASEVVGKTVPETQYEQVTGTDGLAYSSLPNSAYATRMVLLNAVAAYRLPRGFRVTLDGYNLLDRRHHRPGSLVVPTVLDGLRIIGSLSYDH